MRYLNIGLATLTLWLPSAVTAEVTSDRDIRDVRQDYRIYVDSHGVMRRSDTGEETSYFGTSYALPFTHPYREMERRSENPERVIDCDVYHMARLGMNGCRVILWESELTDADGNLYDNDHLELTDYLIARLEERGIDILLTPMTHLGDGDPEPDMDTGSFIYDFSREALWTDPAAIQAQERYLTSLMRHINPYTGRSYADDNGIIAIEINYSPIQTAEPGLAREYISRMTQAVRKGGKTAPVVYNAGPASDNPGLMSVTDTEGVSFTWIPEKRQPIAVDGGLPGPGSMGTPSGNAATIPEGMARLATSIDIPAADRHQGYSAITHALRREGFQWITQADYDPTPIASTNTWRTQHYLNLAYTPARAVSMLIAAEVARSVPRGTDSDRNASDNVWLTVSPSDGTEVLNDGIRYRHTGSTRIPPADPSGLAHIAGTGNSPLVTYPGTGAYFVDQTSTPGVWRLEVMPDVVVAEDPFGRAAPSRHVADIIHARHPMTVSLEGLDPDFHCLPLISGTHVAPEMTRACGNTVEVSPGIYLLGNDAEAIRNTDISETLPGPGNIGICEFAAPMASTSRPRVIHTPRSIHQAGIPCGTEALLLTPVPLDRVSIYGTDADGNQFETQMTPDACGVRWTGSLPPSGPGNIMYNIVAIDADGHASAFPGNHPGAPYDWDWIYTDHYATQAIGDGQHVSLLSPCRQDPAVTVTSTYPGAKSVYEAPDSEHTAAYLITAPRADAASPGYVTISRNVSDIASCLGEMPRYSNLSVFIETDAEDMPDRGIFRSPISVDITMRDGSASRTSVIPDTPFPTDRTSGQVRFCLTVPLEGRISPADMEYVSVSVPADCRRETTFRLTGIDLR